MAYGGIRELRLEIDGQERTDLVLVQMQGTEEISAGFQFDLECVALHDADVDLEALLFKAVRVTLTQALSERVFNGIITLAAYRGFDSDDTHHYTLRMEPAMSRLRYSEQNQIHGCNEDLSVVDVVVRELTGEGARGVARESAAALRASDVDVGRLALRYPLRDYVTQYRESNLNFVERLLEHWGIFYFFEDGDDGEVLVLGDDNVVFAPIPPLEEETPAEGQVGTPVPFITYGGTVAENDDAVRSLRHTRGGNTRKVVMRDYQNDTPQRPLHTEHDVEPELGFGVVCAYGDDFRTLEEGRLLARVRAEAYRAHGGDVFWGESNTARLRAGGVFALTDHPRQAFNTDYVVVKVTHRIRLAHPFTELFGDEVAEGYGNEFEVLPLAVPFRPKRRAFIPTVAGHLSATVDSAGVGERADLDQHGRYLLRMPYDQSGQPDGSASRRVPMAQPYAGPNAGMHFPLRKQTEVLVGHFNGDPNRPFIAAAIPNPQTPSPSRQGSHYVNQIATPSGIRISLDDGTGSGAGVRNDSQQAGPACPAAAVAARFGDMHFGDPGLDVYGDEDATAGMEFAVIDVNGHTGVSMGKQIYFFTGESMTFAGEQETTSDGWYDFTRSDHLSIALGNRQEFTKGERVVAVENNSRKIVEKAQYIEVRGGQETNIKGGEDLTYKMHVVGDTSETFKGNYTQTVDGVANQHFNEGRNVFIKRKQVESTTEDYWNWTNKNKMQGVGGTDTKIVAGLATNLYGAAYTQVIVPMKTEVIVGLKNELGVLKKGTAVIESKLYSVGSAKKAVDQQNTQLQQMQHAIAMNAAGIAMNEFRLSMRSSKLSLTSSTLNIFS